jgi:simple sugar transport system permease protein
MISARNLPTLATIGVFLLGYAFAASQFPAMLSLRVIGNLLTDNAFLGILAVGMTVVIVSGGIDLSVGAVMAFTTVLLALLVQAGVPPFAAFAVALAVGAAFGAAVGAAIHVLKAPAFIVTLTGMFLARGASLLLSTESVPVRHTAYEALSSFAIRLPEGGKLSFVAIVMLLAFGLGGLLLHASRAGANVYALGGDAHAAQLMGVPVGRTTVMVYAFSGFCAALAGVVFSIYTQAGYALSGVGVELDAIAAVVIGGALLTGGAGGVIGSFFGVLIQGLILTYITFDGALSSWWTKIVIGLLLFVFVALQRVLLRLPLWKAPAASGGKA